MLRSLARAAAIIAALASSAAAGIEGAVERPERPERPERIEPRPALVFGRATSQAGCIVMMASIDQVAITARPHDWLATLDLAITLSARGNDTRVSLPLSVPAGARVTRMIVITHGERFAATARSAGEALERFRAATNTGRDPGLLRWDGESFGSDHLVLDVAPVSATQPARIELSLEVPRAPVMELVAREPIGRVELEVLGSAPSRASWSRMEGAARIDLGAPVGEHAARAGTAVDSITSLYAGPEIALATPPWQRAWLSKVEIANAILLRRPRLRWCYMQALQRRPTLAGRADLQFTIREDGGVEDVSVGGELSEPGLSACLAAEVGALEFRPHDMRVVVNYPLELVPRVARR